MSDFKVWYVECPDKSGWWVMKSSTPNDERPCRIIGKVLSEDEAKDMVAQCIASM